MSSSSPISHSPIGKVKKSKRKSAKKAIPYAPVSSLTQVPAPVLPNPAILTVINIDPALLASAQIKAEEKHPGQPWKQLVEVKWSILPEYTRWCVNLASSTLDEKAQLKLLMQLVIEPKEHPAVVWLNDFNTLRCTEFDINMAKENKEQDEDEDENEEYMTWCKGPGVNQKGCKAFFRKGKHSSDSDKCKVCNMVDCAFYLRDAWCKDCHVKYATRDYEDDHVKAVLRSSLTICTKCKCRYNRTHGGCQTWYDCDGEDE